MQRLILGLLIVLAIGLMIPDGPSATAKRPLGYTTYGATQFNALTEEEQLPMLREIINRDGRSCGASAGHLGAFGYDRETGLQKYYVECGNTVYRVEIDFVGDHAFVTEHK